MNSAFGSRRKARKVGQDDEDEAETSASDSTIPGQSAGSQGETARPALNARESDLAIETTDADAGDQVLHR
jgi:hypothetical protein